MPLNKGIFLDRDGTLIQDGPFLDNPDDLRFLPGVLEGLRALKQEGFLLVVVTNQSGVGRGFFDEATVHKIHAKLCRILDENHSPIDAIYFCPHPPSHGCGCRKPAAGLFKLALDEHGIDASRSYAIGDQVRDILPGREVGCKTVLLGDDDRKSGADHIASDFMDAVQWVVRNSRGETRKPS